MLSVLAITIFLFVTKSLRVDVIAILIMLALGWLELVTPQQVFSGLGREKRESAHQYRFGGGGPHLRESLKIWSVAD